MFMKKILVIFTGGTIGSRIQNSTIDVDDSTGYYLLKLYKEKYNTDVEFDTIQPINILSENCTPNHWEKLYKTINQVEIDRYNGIIITHGTDTLPYTSAILGFLFHHTEIPIVITGSNHALEIEESNGLDNFNSSVEFITNSGIRGVYTIYQSNNKKNIVYLSSRIREADSYNDQFYSFGGIDLGEIKDGCFKINKNRINPTMGELVEHRRKLLDCDIDFTNQVFAIKPYPGLDYNFFNFEYKPKAILHSLYHSGTGCISDSSSSLPKFVKKCKDEGIDFYLISFKNIDSDLYVTSREILKYGAIPLQNISFEAAYAKLNIAYNQKILPPQDYIEKDLFFEFLPQ